MVEEGGLYEFTIIDAFNDGICCDFGLGSYRLALVEDMIPDVLVDVDGDFQTSRSHLFVAAPEQPNPSPPEAGDRFLTLTITFDMFPTETLWFVKVTSTRIKKLIHWMIKSC